MTEGIISAIVGGLAGFLTSLFFWRKSQRKDRPRLYFKVGTTDQQNGSTNFEIENEGDTHAINITLDEHPSSDVPSDLGPKAKFYLEVLEADQSKEYILSYFDVWGTRYEAKWQIEGPHKFSIDEKEWIYDYASAVKIYEFQSGGIILKLRRLFRRYI